MSDLALQMIDDFTKNNSWGTLVFEYCDGELVFAIRKETFKPVTFHENNSTKVPAMRRHNGTYDEKLAKD